MLIIETLKSTFLKARSSDLLKSFFVLLSGSVIAQVIQLLLSPLLSRIYTPAEFGVFSIFFSISYFIYVISSFRFDYCIIMQKNKDRALNMVLNCFIISTMFSLLFFFVFIVNRMTFINIVKIPFNHYYWFGFGLLLVILLFSYSNIISYYFNHQKKYSQISFSTVLRVLSTLVLQLGLGYFFESEYGLIYGLLIGVCFSLIYLLYFFWPEIKHLFKVSKKRYSFLLMKKNIDFLKYNTPHVIIDNLMMHGFILYLSYSFTVDDVGSYGFANRIVRAPILLIGSTLARVMFKQLSESYNEQKSFGPLIKSTTKIIAFVVIPSLVIIPFIKEIFVFLFGASWQIAANVSFFLIFPSILNLIILPFANIAYVLGKNKAYFIISMMNLLIILLSILLNQLYKFSFENYIKLYALFLSITICFTAIWLFMITRKYEKVISKIN